MFRFDASRGTLKRELLAAFTTFFTMSYILVVNPNILGTTGLPYESIFVATALAAGISSIVMGLFADRPFAMASGMGLNAYFAYSVIGGMGFSYGAALAAVFFSGLFMTLVSLSRFDFGSAAPESFRHALIGGLGLFLVFVGMQNAHFVVTDANTIISLGNIHSAPALIAIIGFFLTSLMIVRRIDGALFISMALTAIIAMIVGFAPFPNEIVQGVPDISNMVLKIEFGEIFNLKLLPVIWTFFIITFFDAFGTITALGTNPKFWSRNEEKKAANTAITLNSFGSVVGSMLGVPTVTTFMESASGIAAGGRTGLVAIVVGILFLVSIFFFPLVKAVPVEAAAPAIIIVGLFMLSGIKNIKYSDQSEAIPALLTLGAIPFTYSIATGIGVGSISYVFLKMVSGKIRDIHPAMYVIALFSILNFAKVF